MKFFHLSDLHIGKQLHLYSLKEDQEAILKEIIDYAEKLKPQAIVIAGDIYDKSVPSAEAVAVFNEFLREAAKLDVDILLISGNHDSPERLDFASFLLEKQHLYIGGIPPVRESEHLKRVVFKDEWGEVDFWLLPFMKPSYVRGLFPEEEISSYTEAVKKILERENIQDSVRNVLVCHQFFTASGKKPIQRESETFYVGGTGNVDITSVSQFDYVAMGHLHKGQSVGAKRFCYCGTPLKYSVSESQDEKYLTVVTLEKKEKEPVIEQFPLHPIRDVKCFSGNLKELLSYGCEDYVSVTLTDEILPYQPREQLNRVFPNLLEVKVENSVTKKQWQEVEQQSKTETPIELFQKFYEEIHGNRMNEKEQKIIEKLMDRILEEER